MNATKELSPLGGTERPALCCCVDADPLPEELSEEVPRSRLQCLEVREDRREEGSAKLDAGHAGAGGKGRPILQERLRVQDVEGVTGCCGDRRALGVLRRGREAVGAMLRAFQQHANYLASHV